MPGRYARIGQSVQFSGVTSAQGKPQPDRQSGLNAEAVGGVAPSTPLRVVDQCPTADPVLTVR